MAGVLPFPFYLFALKVYYGFLDLMVHREDVIPAPEPIGVKEIAKPSTNAQNEPILSF